MERKTAIAQRNEEIEMLDVYMKLLGIDLSKSILLKLYFSLPDFMKKREDFDLLDLARAVQMAKKAMEEEAEECVGTDQPESYTEAVTSEE